MVLVLENPAGNRLSLPVSLALDSWDVSMDTPSESFTGRPGALALPSGRVMKERKLTVTGTLEGLDAQNLDSLLTQISAFCLGQDWIKLWRYDGAPRFARCFCDGINAPYIRGRFKGRLATITLSFTAFDPFWYSEEIIESFDASTGAPVAIFNPGTEPSPALLVLEASGGGNLGANVLVGYGHNLFLDADFEGDGSAWTALAGAVRQSALHFHNGSLALKLSPSDHVVQTVPLVPGRVVCLSAWVWSSSATTLRLYMRLNPSLVVNTRDVAVGAGWSRVSYSLLVPSAQIGAEAGFLNNGAATIYVDDAQAEIVEDLLAGPRDYTPPKRVALSFGTAVAFVANDVVIADPQKLTLTKNGTSILGSAGSSFVNSFMVIEPGINVLKPTALALAVNIRYAPRYR